MKHLLLPLIATLAIPTAVEANLFQKEPTYKQIVSQCKGAGSKYSSSVYEQLKTKVCEKYAKFK